MTSMRMHTTQLGTLALAAACAALAIAWPTWRAELRAQGYYYDECAPAPLAGCRVPTIARKAVLMIDDKSPDSRDVLVWRWIMGEETPFDALGDPTSTDAYSLCVYDVSGGEPALLYSATAPAGAVCGRQPCWKVTETPPGFTYRDRNGAVDGITRVQLESGLAKLAKAIVRVEGAGTEPPLLPLPLPATVQLQAANGACFEATFFERGVGRNEAEQFRGRAGDGVDSATATRGEFNLGD